MSTEVAEAPATTEVIKAPEDSVPLAERWKGGMEKLAKETAQPEPKEEAKPKQEEAKPKEEEAKKPETKPEAKTEKPKSALDAVLGDKTKAEAKSEVAETEIPANAPAKTLRDAYERQKAEAAKWKAEAEKVKGGDPEVKTKLEVIEREREALKVENQKLRDAVTAINVDYDPTVQEKYVVGKAKLIEKATKAVDQFGGDAKAFTEAMKLSGAARTAALKAALENVDDMDRQPIFDKLNRVRELEEEHADLVANSQQSYEKLTKAQQERAIAQQEQAEQQKASIAEKALKSLSTKHPLFLEAPADTDGADDYNARLKADLEKAAYLRGPDAEWNEISEASAKAARYDFLEETHLEYRETSQAEIADLKGRLAKYEGADTSLVGGKKPGGEDSASLTPGQRYTRERARQRESAGV